MKILLAGAAFAVLSSGAMAQDMKLKFQSSDPAGDANYLLYKEWADNVAEETGGAVAIELLPVGSVVDFQETLDAVGAGILDGHITDTSYFAGKDAAFGLIANPVGAWSDPQQLLKFINEGGGKELMNELVEPYGTHFFGGTTPGLEAFVSSVPLEGVEDLKGLKLRAPAGLVQNIFAAAGASPVNLPTSEVFTALDKGVVEAADYSVFHVNQAQGLNKIAQHPVFPGFHSMPLIEFSMNKAKWDALSPEVQKTLEESVVALAQRQNAALADKNAKAVEQAEAEGATIHDWSDEERAKFRKIAIGEWEKQAGQSANAQKVYDTLTTYLDNEGLLKAE